MGYDITLTTPSNQLNFKRLLDCNWHLYSNMSVGVVRNDFDYMDLAGVRVGEIKSTEQNIRRLEHV